MSLPAPSEPIRSVFELESRQLVTRLRDHSFTGAVRMTMRERTLLATLLEEYLDCDASS